MAGINHDGCVGVVSAVEGATHSTAKRETCWDIYLKNRKESPSPKKKETLIF